MKERIEMSCYKAKLQIMVLVSKKEDETVS
jgi:hypothetical protein